MIEIRASLRHSGSTVIPTTTEQRTTTPTRPAPSTNPTEDATATLLVRTFMFKVLVTFFLPWTKVHLREFVEIPHSSPGHRLNNDEFRKKKKRAGSSCSLF